jgi:hypothetical protein
MRLSLVPSPRYRPHMTCSLHPRSTCSRDDKTTSLTTTAGFLLVGIRTKGLRSKLYPVDSSLAQLPSVDASISPLQPYLIVLFTSYFLRYATRSHTTHRTHDYDQLRPILITPLPYTTACYTLASNDNQDLTRDITENRLLYITTDESRCRLGPEHRKYPMGGQVANYATEV